MGNSKDTITKSAEDIRSNLSFPFLVSNIVLIIYVSGYLALRFHLTALGLDVDLPLVNERYLFDGAKFFIFIFSIATNLIVLLVPFMAIFMNETVRIFFHNLWKKIRSWEHLPNLLTGLGILFSLFMIQGVMKESFLLSNLLLEDIPEEIYWLRKLLCDPKDLTVSIYFMIGLTIISLLIGLFYCAWKSFDSFKSLNMISISKSNSGYTYSLLGLLGFLICVQLFFIPIIYGALVLDKSMPKTEVFVKHEESGFDGEKWLVWEGAKSKTFFVRHGNNKSLITLPDSNILRLDICGHNNIFSISFSQDNCVNKGGSSEQKTC